MKTPIFSLLLATLTCLSASAIDWPQWRGPNRDCVVTDAKHKLDKLPADPKVLWKIDAGSGHSSPVVAGGKLVFIDGISGQEITHCVDAAAGKPFWSVPIGPMVEF